MYFITRCIITISDGRDSELIALVVDVLFDVPCILYTSMWRRDVCVEKTVWLLYARLVPGSQIPSKFYTADLCHFMTDNPSPPVQPRVFSLDKGHRVELSGEDNRVIK